MQNNLTIIQALEDENLLGGFIQRETWGGWFTLFRAMFALRPAKGDLKLFRQCTGRKAWPTVPAREVYIIAGRRSGKSINVSLLATYASAFCKYEGLAKGERATIPIVSPTRQQSRIIQRYIWRMFHENAFLLPLVERETTTELDLSNAVSIEIMVADARFTRGYTSPLVLLDESAFFSTEANRSDVEVIRSWRPALATLEGTLVCISSPYSKVGALYNAWKRSWGQSGDVLVWQAASKVMNPTLKDEVIRNAMEEDPESAQAEWQAQWRSDIESFVSREVVEACMVSGRVELPPVASVLYRGFCDPSGGRGDAFTLGISHAEGERFVIDVLRERKPPFNPTDVIAEYAAILRQYHVTRIKSDRYGGEFVVSAFKAHHIDCQPCEKPKSDLYRDLLPLLNSQRVELPENDSLLHELINLERRVTRGGRDSIDHGVHGHDDLANAVAGACFELQVKSDLLFPFL